jgi:murein L,D-transpeptidase YcbB/YkuD
MVTNFFTDLNYLSTPVSSLIKTLVVNMERCRWVSKTLARQKELIAVNIPSYELTYFKRAIVLQSNVVVGRHSTKL